MEDEEEDKDDDLSMDEGKERDINAVTNNLPACSFPLR
jgi:hypothetical protein